MLGDRFYARVHAFDAACPSCGFMIRAGQAQGQKGVYTPRIAQASCPQCHRPYIVGLVLWPIKVGGGQPGRRPTRPADQLPGPRERLAYRNQAGGWWPKTSLDRTRAETSNITGPEEESCGCDPDGEHSPSCGLHT